MDHNQESKVILQFLGCGDAFGSGARLQTCLYVDSGLEKFLLDIGASGLISLKRWGRSTAEIDTILITHLHADHFGGLPIFLIDAQLVSKRERPLTIAGPPTLEQRLQQAQEVMYPGSSQERYRFPMQIIELVEGAPIQIGSLKVTAFVVEHFSGAPSYALRVETMGKAITYSGDTEWTDSLVEAAEGADLFICESNFFQQKVQWHMDYKTLMRHREALNCKRMVLTHLGEEMLERVGELEVEVAEDGMLIQV
jgi:ribonuclease BN (tRNA processing enzyme)